MAKELPFSSDTKRPASCQLATTSSSPESRLRCLRKRFKSSGLKELAMNKIRLAAALAATLTCSAFAVKVGTPAPNFSATDTHGKTQQLSAYKGKYVVLEWTNGDLPLRARPVHQRQHAIPPEAVERKRRRLALGHLLSSRPAGIQDGQRRERLPDHRKGLTDGRPA